MRVGDRLVEHPLDASLGSLGAVRSTPKLIDVGSTLRP